MNTEKSYGLVLDYDFFPMEVYPREYLETGKKKYLKEYRKLTARHLEELFAHLRGQNNGSWNAQILAVSTCKQGKVINQYYECGHTIGIEDCYRTENREELHIHILVSGENCSEIVKCIEDYWTDNFGDAEDTAQEYLNLPTISEWERYFDSRQLVKRYLVFGNLYGSPIEAITDDLYNSGLF